MHILLITNYFPPDGGAAAVRLGRLAERLVRRGHDVTVLTSLPHYPQGRIQADYRRRWVVVEERDGLRVVQTWLWATSNPRISRKLLSQLSFMMTAFVRGLFLPRPDVILIEAQPIFTGWAGRILAMLKRRPYVLNVSDLWPDHLLSVGVLTENDLIYRLARGVVNEMYRSAAGIITMSATWSERIAGYIGPSPKIQTIYNGVDLEKFSPTIDATHFRQTYDLGDAKIISFIGTLATQYDFATLIEAWAQFSERKDVLFLLVGKGSQAETIERLISEQPIANLRHIDWLPHEQLPAVWRASYVTMWAMVNHDLYRGTIPAKLYEALACGTPILAATEGISAEILAESGGGQAVLCNDADGLGQILGQVLDDPSQREAMSQAARRYALAHYDPDEVARRYEAALQTSAQRGL